MSDYELQFIDFKYENFNKEYAVDNLCTEIES